MEENIILENYIKQISIGNNISLELLYNETRNYVYNFALSIMKNPTDAEDIMQDTYVNINRYAKNYNPRNKPLAWILTITRNLCLNKLKSNKKKEYTDITEVEQLLGKSDQNFNKLLLKTILEDLEEEERQIVILNSIDNFKFREIANLLNLKLSTVLSKHNRAIKKIRSIYKDGVK